MKNIIGVRFKKPGKIYFFDPGDLQVDLKDYVIVETSQGEEMGEVAICNRKLPDEKLVAPLKPIIRIATEEDKKHNEENKKKEKEAFEICQQKIKKHKLDMNLHISFPTVISTFSSNLCIFAQLSVHFTCFFS